MNSRSKTLPCRSLLLVEDEASVAEALSWALQSAGRVCYRAATIDTAISVLAEHGDIASVLLDRGLVVGVLAETVARIRRAAPGVAIVGTSGRDCREEFLDAGADDYVAKPLTVKQLLACVDSHCSGDA